jgi:hypothetical protein
VSIIQHNPPGLFPPYRAYSHAIEVNATTRLLIISGLSQQQPPFRRQLAPQPDRPDWTREAG